MPENLRNFSPDPLNKFLIRIKKCIPFPPIPLIIGKHLFKTSFRKMNMEPCKLACGILREISKHAV